MNKEKLYQNEWDNPANWSHPVFGLYFSKRDPRAWVPKKIGIGWTLNMGHPHAAWWFVGLLLGSSWLAALAARRKS